MGYFNYFIKCIIRNIAYKICKPKVFFTIILALAILFGLKHFGYCALDDTDYEMISDGFATITANQGTIISQLSSMGVNVGDIESQLNTIKSMINDINDDTTNIANRVASIMTKIDTLNANIINIYNTLETNQQELITELQTENQKVLEELQQLRDALVGSEATSVSSQNMGSLQVNLNGSKLSNIRKIYIPMEYGYTYNISVTYTNPTSSELTVHYFFYKNVNDNSVLIPVRGRELGRIPANSTSTFTISSRDYLNSYLYMSLSGYYQGISVTASIEGVVDVIDRTNQEINTGIQEGNQLQEESNQLQQEQNEFLKDDDVNTEGFEFATNDTNNPTEEGFNTLFTSIYNAFCNTSSAPLTITLPYVNETFTIQPNLVSNAMQKCGLGFVATLIQSFYYYGVCLFIYKDINKIIEHLKSGNLTADCGNVKTEVL